MENIITESAVRFHASAANEAGFDIIATVFRSPSHVTEQPAAEIEQIAWVAPVHPDQPRAPLLRDFVFPLLQ
ncbi:hypothetical protein QP027_12015 [Corynebacterium breve]|uniref:NUDIX hydrolase n=1 Tax=Corynebacterium breve TaxID=3049799 RepID=A0ABY8VF95_9CORY|nr:hypothetical protein [Corynebacterium breve]WIM67777.1 hypothetical protein QP027_12015 [Corynebacterium breve]